jgi:hypothetical protein
LKVYLRRKEEETAVIVRETKEKTEKEKNRKEGNHKGK